MHFRSSAQEQGIRDADASERQAACQAKTLAHCLIGFRSRINYQEGAILALMHARDADLTNIKSSVSDLSVSGAEASARAEGRRRGAEDVELCQAALSDLDRAYNKALDWATGR